MGRWKAVVAIAVAILLSAGAIVSAPTGEPERLHATMLAPAGAMPGHVHEAGPQAVAAYQAAIDHPEILSSVPCLCGCIPALGHESNLACYVESASYGLTVYSSHGLYCGICHWITEDALAGASQGMSPAQLHEMIMQKYGS